MNVDQLIDGVLSGSSPVGVLESGQEAMKLHKEIKALVAKLGDKARDVTVPNENGIIANPAKWIPRLKKIKAKLQAQIDG